MLAGNCMAAGPYPGAEFEAMHGGVGAPSVLMDPNWIALDPGDVSQPELQALAAQWNLNWGAMQDCSVGRWIWVPRNGDHDAASTLRLIRRMADSDTVACVAPVLVGGTLQLPFVPTADLLLRVQRDAPAGTLQAIADAHALTIERTDLGGLGIARLQTNLRHGGDIMLLAAQLSQRADVEFAESDSIRWASTFDMPNDPEFGAQWGLHQANDHDMDAPEAWDTTHGDESVQVVVLDSGIDQNHPDIHQLPGMTFTGSSENGHPGNGCDNHGTAVAGCVSATINNATGVVGVAPNCSVRAGKVFNEISIFGLCLGFLEFQDSWVVSGIGWAASEGARVTNSSWGGGSASGAITAAFNDTFAQGLVHVAAAGNDGTSTIGWPASLSNMLAASAMQSNGTLASFSTHGNGLFAATPGAGIRTTDRSGSDGYDGGDTTTIDGTSFASPYLAGVAAMVLSMDDELSATGVADILAATAVDYGSAGWDIYFGHGFINVAAAVAAADPGTDCAGDINGDGMVGADDILAVLSDWGTCDGCPGDIDNDGIVGVNDLLTIIGAFGPC
jgi:hypothetical protein